MEQYTAVHCLRQVCVEEPLIYSHNVISLKMSALSYMSKDLKSVR